MSSSNKIRRIVSTWQKLARINSKKSSAAVAAAAAAGGANQSCVDEVDLMRAADRDDHHKLPDEATFTVYVGKEQRRYELGEHFLGMPLFMSLVAKSQGSIDQGLHIPCEVVMFDHLLWMLENHSSALQHAESVDELIDFYAY